MVWISGIKSTRDGLQVRLQRHDGSTTVAPLSAADADLRIWRSSKRKLRLNLSAFRPACTSTYLKALGQEQWESGGQGAYQAELGDETLVVPSQLLVLGLVTAASRLRKFVLLPWSPSHLSTALATEKKIEVFPGRPTIGANEHTVAARLEWMNSYPSGHAAWGSVYRNALGGSLDLLLPQGMVEVIVHVSPVGKTLLATRLNVLELETVEAPFEFAVGLARTKFEFSNYVGTPTLADDSLRHPAIACSMTDLQWSRIEPVLRAFFPAPTPSAPRVHSLRDLLSAMLYKLGTPCRWQDVPVSKEMLRSAQVLFSKLRQAGLWEQVACELGSM